MSTLTQPVFILGSGRCGTYAMAKLLEDEPRLEVHHEYLFEHVLSPAVQFRMGVLSRQELINVLKETHMAAIHHSEAARWVDCSNALPWIIGPLYELFPNAHFIHLVRDGRKVVSSFYNKFRDLMYGDRSVALLEAWARDPDQNAKPPLDKRFWRPLPRDGEPFADQFRGFDQFERNCYYWQDVVSVALDALADIPDQQKSFFRLEDLVGDRETLQEVLRIMDLTYEERFWETLQRPINVATPKNFGLLPAQRESFDRICGPMMSRLGYKNQQEYDVQY